MIPILMQDKTTVGFLKEAMSCVVTEERNGVFEMSPIYPVTGALFDKLQIDRFVKAKTNETADLQLFRIYEVTKPMNGVVTVRHKDLGIDMKAQVMKTVYDTIADRYNKIELGSAKASFVDTIRQTTDDLPGWCSPSTWRRFSARRITNTGRTV